jgi:hypothetical protein
MKAAAPKAQAWLMVVQIENPYSSSTETLNMEDGQMIMNNDVNRHPAIIAVILQ